MEIADLIGIGYVSFASIGVIHDGDVITAFLFGFTELDVKAESASQSCVCTGFSLRYRHRPTF